MARQPKVATVPLQYPSYLPGITTSSPTPATRLMVCDHCRVAEWHIRGTGQVYHRCQEGIPHPVLGKGRPRALRKQSARWPKVRFTGRRMREATACEYAQARQALGKLN